MMKQKTKIELTKMNGLTLTGPFFYIELTLCLKIYQLKITDLK